MPKDVLLRPGESEEWETPQVLFNELDAEFHFTLDPCATPENTKCLRFFTKEEDGLVQEWTGAVFMNPPYGRKVGQWVRKAWESAKKGAVVVCLIPSRTDTVWWHDIVLASKAEIRYIRGRIRFIGGNDRAPFPSAVVIFRGKD